MSQLAKLAHKFNVVRSFATRNAGHNIQPIVSSFSKEAAISTHFARIAGATRLDSGMPTTAVLFPASVNKDVPGPSARGNLSETGNYGAGFAPFVPGKGGKLQEDMKPPATCRPCRARICLLYTSPSPRDRSLSRMPSSA